MESKDYYLRKSNKIGKTQNRLNRKERWQLLLSGMKRWQYYDSADSKR